MMAGHLQSRQSETVLTQTGWISTLNTEHGSSTAHRLEVLCDQSSVWQAQTLAQQPAATKALRLPGVMA